MIFKGASRSFNYEEFLEYAQEVVNQYETEPNESEDPKFAFFSKLNLQRMKRWNKTFQVNDSIVEALGDCSNQDWWLITEVWCGDSAQNLPVLAAIAKMVGARLRIVLRDENPAIMEQYLTNGAKSIPVLVGFHNEQQLFKWGPRPAGAQVIFNDWKANPNGRDFDAFEHELQTWYTLNKGAETQQELVAAILGA